MLRRVEDSNEPVVDKELEAQVTGAFVGSFQCHLHFLVEKMDPIVELEGASASKLPVLSDEMSREIRLSEMMRVVIDSYFEMTIVVWALLRIHGEGGFHLVQETVVFHEEIDNGLFNKQTYTGATASPQLNSFRLGD